VIRPKCKEDGLKSYIYGKGGGTTTLIGFTPYYDEEGVYHIHDANKHELYFECSNDHKFRTINSGKCPNCSFGHDSEKVEILA
jgi:hypothetical protein